MGAWEDSMGAKFLIVDDEESLVFFLEQTLLIEFPGSRVDAAYSGEEGLSLLAERAYDLILADLRMPGFDGLELIKGVRYLNPTIPIILMTGYGSKVLRTKAAQLGVNYYFDKPFDVREMLAAVQQLVSDGGGEVGD
jgi:DNA-binding response OmpR family regulator